MADFSDVTAALKAVVVGLAYPNGTGVASALGVDIQVTEGWPLPATLDLICGKPNVSLPNPVTLVSIYPIPQTTGDGGTCMDMSGGVVKSHAAAGLSVTVEDATVTLSGVADGIENVVVIVNKAKPYGAPAQAGSTAASVATALFALIVADFPGAELDLSIPETPTIDVVGAYALTARVGTTGVLQRTTHRERQQLRITCWSSNPVDRNTVGKQIDALIKAQVHFDLPDGTDSIVTYSGMNLSDDPERIGLFRRDNIYAATCDSIEEIDAVEITAMGFQTTLPGGAVLSSSS